MGHLINPIAFRLGVNKSWEDFWYVKNIYYSETLHNILNFKNFVYYFFTREKSKLSGILLNEIFFLKINKYFTLYIYIYHLELEKASYKFINKLYTVYYKVTRKKRTELPPNFWFLHNADIYAFIFVFYNIFIGIIKNIKKRISKSIKFKNKNIKSSEDYAPHIKFILRYKKRRRKKIYKMDTDHLVERYNDLILGTLKSKGKLIDIFKFVLFNIFYKYKKRMEYNALHNFKWNYRYKKKLEFYKFKYGKRVDFLKELNFLSQKSFLTRKNFIKNLIYYIKSDYNKIRVKKGILLKTKDATFIKFLNDVIRNNNRVNTNWFLRGKRPKFEFDNEIMIEKNLVNFSFLYFFLYVCKKFQFQKYNNSFDFYKKWNYIFNYLKSIKNLKYSKRFKKKAFIIYMSLFLFLSLRAKKIKSRFYVRNTIYSYIYIWLGLKSFFPFFKNFADVFKYIFKFFTKNSNIFFKFIFISLEDVSAHFIATYISLKLKKRYHLFKIINPIKKELWRLSRLLRRPLSVYRLKRKKILRRKRFFLKLFFIKMLKIKKIFDFKIFIKDFTFIFFELYEFKRNLKIHLLKQKCIFKFLLNYIHKYIYSFFIFGKLRNYINIKPKNFKFFFDKKPFRWIFSKLNLINYLNLKNYKIINSAFLLFNSNILRASMKFNDISILWDQ